MPARISPPTATRSILVAEDSPDVRELLELALEAEGYRVVALGDGRDVVPTARALRPALITLDLALPGKDGETIVRELEEHRETRDIPILVISGHTRELDPSVRRRAARVFSKPVYVTQLVDQIKHILGA
jgi:CheY-like chemotaxis protein